MTTATMWRSSHGVRAVSCIVPDAISVPLTMFVDYDGADYQQGGENDQLIELTFLFGISLHFGGDRAQDDAKRFDLPEYYRWVGQTGGALE